MAREDSGTAEAVDRGVGEFDPAQVLLGGEVVGVDPLLIAVQIVSDIEERVSFKRDTVGLLAMHWHRVDGGRIAWDPFVGIGIGIVGEVRVVHGLSLIHI